MKMNSRSRSFSAIVVVASMLFAAQVPVMASELTDENIALMAVQPFKPVLSETVAKLISTEDPGRAPAAELVVVNDSPKTVVSIAPVEAVGVRQVDVDTLSFDSTDESVRYVAETNANGLQLFSVSLEKSESSSFSYKFEGLGVGSSMRPHPDGQGFVIFDDEGLAVGGVKSPWAYDANKKSLDTSYSWHEGTLTQHVDFGAAGIEYPVVADPAWYYTAQYPLNNAQLTPLKVMNKMKDCFNCYFPVEGAPAAYPTPGQFLPLVVRLAPFLPTNNFNCIFDMDSYYTEHDFNPSIPQGSAEDTGNFWFRFTSAPGHVDGPGSSIRFWITTTRFSPPQGFPFASYQLIVEANITNDFGVVGNDAYYFGAEANWAKFAQNLVVATY